MRIFNKKATFDYQLLDHFEAGIKLVGAEVKAVRDGHVDLTGSFVRLIQGEATLFNANIFPYKFARPETFDSRRTRKLLLHKKEIISLKSKIDGAHLTIVPVSLYTTHSLIKIELAIAKPKKKFDKKEAIKNKDIDRDIERELRNKK
jgi:SsrA-binding protein